MLRRGPYGEGGNGEKRQGGAAQGSRTVTGENSAPRVSLPRSRRTGDLRREVRPVDGTIEGGRSRESGTADARFADQARGRDAARGIRVRTPRAGNAKPRQRVFLRYAARMGPPRSSKHRP